MDVWIVLPLLVLLLSQIILWGLLSNTMRRVKKMEENVQRDLNPWRGEMTRKSNDLEWRVKKLEMRQDSGQPDPWIPEV